KETRHRKRRILRWHGVSFTHEKTIAPGIARVLRVVAHLVEIQGGHDVRQRKRTAEVMRLVGTHHAHDAQAHFRCHLLEACNLRAGDWLARYGMRAAHHRGLLSENLFSPGPPWSPRWYPLVVLDVRLLVCPRPSLTG